MKRLLMTLGATVLIAATARADAEADALLREVELETKAVSALAADFKIIEIVAGKRVLRHTGTVKLMRPGLARIELKAPDVESIMADGRAVWRLRTVSGRQQFSPVRLDKRGFDDRGRPFGLPGAYPLSYFFNPGLSSVTAPAIAAIVQDVETRLLADETLDGQTYRVIEMKPRLPKMMPAQKIKLYIGPEMMLERVTSSDGDKPAQEFVLSSVRVDAAMPEREFVFAPPQGATLADNDYNAKLLPVGSTVPDFALPAAAGGRVNLAEAAQGKKAVLINFWFYG